MYTAFWVNEVCCKFQKYWRQFIAKVIHSCSIHWSVLQEILDWKSSLWECNSSFVAAKHIAHNRTLLHMYLRSRTLCLRVCFLPAKCLDFLCVIAKVSHWNLWEHLRSFSCQSFRRSWTWKCYPLLRGYILGQIFIHFFKMTKCFLPWMNENGKTLSPYLLMK